MRWSFRQLRLIAGYKMAHGQPGPLISDWSRRWTAPPSKYAHSWETSAFSMAPESTAGVLPAHAQKKEKSQNVGKQVLGSGKRVMVHPTHLRNDTPAPVLLQQDGVYRCPCCLFGSSKQHSIHIHLKNHLKLAVRHGEYVICKCSMPCRESHHFHCITCEKTIVKRAWK